MRTIDTWTCLQALIEVCAGQRAIVALAKRLQAYDEQPLGDLCEIIVVEPADRLEHIETKVGRPLRPPPWEYVDCAGGWFELVLVTGDDGFGHVVFVPDVAAIDPEILEYCRTLTT